MHNVTERVYIFSVCNSTRDDKLNELVHEKHVELLKGKGYTPTTVLVRYAGKDEKSILLYGTNLTEPVVEEFSKAQLQESFLVVYHDGVAELVFTNGIRKIIGDFKEVPEAVAKSKDVYSKIGNQWFIVE